MNYTNKKLKKKIYTLVRHTIYIIPIPNTLMAAPAGSTSYFNLGYERELKKDYDNMKKYYLLAIENNNARAACRLANYYKEQCAYDDMEKYYLLAIENGNFIAANNLAVHYETQHNYDGMVKYYLLALEHGILVAAWNLAIHYHLWRNHADAIKYYLLSAECDHSNLLKNLASCYEETGNFVEAFKYHALNVDAATATATTGASARAQLNVYANKYLQCYPATFKNNNFDAYLNAQARKSGTILNVLVKHRKYFDCTNIKMLNNLFAKKIINGTMVKKCDICFEKGPVVKLACSPTHELCLECFCKINASTPQMPKCPYCRTTLTFGDDACTHTRIKLKN